MDDIGFDIGDRVLLTEDNPDDNYKLVCGDTGVVVGTKETCVPDDPILKIRWDKYVDGHSCDGLCEDGYGWNVSALSLRVISEDIPDPDDADLSDYFDNLIHSN